MKSIAGEPQTFFPAGTSCITAAPPPIIDCVPMVTWSLIPACPASTTPSSTGQQTTFTDYTIVADLHKVIYFCAGPYYGIAEFRPVNAAVSADLNAIFNYNAAVVRNPFVLAIDKFISVSRRSDCGVSQNDAIVAYLAVVIDPSIRLRC